MKTFKLDNPDIDNLEVLGQQIAWKQENAANVIEGTVLLLPKTEGPPIHFHPKQDEEFYITEGELQVYKKDKWVTLKAGQEIKIPAKTPHTYKNTSANPVVFEFRITPEGRFKQMIQEMDDQIGQGKIKGKDLKSMMRMSKIMAAYPDVTQNVNPPQFVIKTMGALAKIFLN